ncbi:MAG: aromatic ring-hydroxylating dioxygenase subunit alpha [Arenicellales bacterium]|jgi:choline monooxygenase|nr:aromatic ring-hydroxylating dioxygenase subunit alpha [Arenicellales bacterium]MDP6412973.1 aromatic ring-hydroxylating dioxygenase subunit alpha [Arenicellales bacterium]MDP7617588.1 aromatic ring-hydroxylating dioxygenase subunit alpha [Arenicellales bacterium]|tara:strand:+ start:60 stop:1190 length:1131 start_codon:yes stop_codon:yes gene_type:complete
MAVRIDKAFFTAFDQASPVCHGLPAASYTCREFFELEETSLFAASWSFVGFAHQLAKVGDVQPLTVAGKPVFLVRSEADKIRAFHNVCRHRNLKLIDQAGHCDSLITCPYHRWSYDFGGQLRLAPYFGGGKTGLPDGFDLANHGLYEIQCHTFHDWIFVNLDGQAESFDVFVEPLKRQLVGFEPEEFEAVATLEFGEVSTNWKLLMENFIEPYHVQYVHKTTTSQPLEDHYVVVDEHCLGSAIDLTAEQQAGAAVGTLGVSSRYLTLFPNFVLGLYYPDQIGVHLNRPVSENSTHQSRVIYLHRDSDQSRPAVEQLRQLWDSVHREDHEMCERLQAGRHSTVAEDGGVLSPHWEVSVRRFQELVADAVRPGLESKI